MGLGEVGKRNGSQPVMFCLATKASRQRRSVASPLFMLLLHCEVPDSRNQYLSVTNTKILMKLCKIAVVA